jgi:hypothetical protein
VPLQKEEKNVAFYAQNELWEEEKKRLFEVAQFWYWMNSFRCNTPPLK